MPLQIIGAGIGRTGTHSLKLALEELGFGKCYHMDSLISNPEQVTFWKNLKAGNNLDWDSFFTGYQSSVDIPTYYHYKIFMKQYPAAKVILTVRDPDSWYKSFNDTIIKKSKPSFGEIASTAVRLPFNPKLRQQLELFKFVGGYLKEFFPNGFEDKTSVLRFFNEWNQSVIDFVPANQLLVYDVKQGWYPLCTFLNVPVPSKPFPHSNTTKEFIARKL